MWMTINSFAALFGFAGLGIGLSLMTTIARRDGEGDVEGQRAAISSALAISVGLALTLSLIAGIAGPLIPWWRVLNVSDPIAVAEAKPSMAVFAGFFLASIPLSLAGSVWNGLQRTYVVSLFLALGSLLGIAGIAVCVLTGQGLPALTAAAFGGPLVATAMTAALLLLKRPDLRPSRALVGRYGVRGLLGAGAGFFFLQVAITVATSSDSLVLTQVIGPSAVADYSVVWRLFNVPLVLAVSVATVLWPGLSEARSRGDNEWAAIAHRRMVLAACVITVPLVSALVVGGPAVTRVVTQGKIEPALGLYIAFAIATLATVLAGMESVFLNSARIIWPQVVWWVTMALCNIALGIWLSARVGTSGVVWSTALTESLMLIPLAFLSRQLAATSQRSTAMRAG